jgi:ferredoxin
MPGDSHNDPALLDRREALWGAGMAAIGGVLGSLFSLTGCRAPMVYRDYPKGSPTGYLVDPSICTRCGDCYRVCRCDAVGGHPNDAEQCWIIIDKCCACGRCYRVCDVDAIVPCYGPDKKPAHELPAFTPGKFGYAVSPNAAPSAKKPMNWAGEPSKHEH